MFKKLIIASLISSAMNTFAAESDLTFDNNTKLSISDYIKKVPVDNIIQDKSGKIKFLIRFKSVDSVTNKQLEKATATPFQEFYNASEENEPDYRIIESDLRMAESQKNWAPTDSKASLKYLQKIYDIESEIVLSVIDKVVSAYLTEEQAEKLAADISIEWVRPDEKMVASGWTDGWTSQQINTWGLSATNTTSSGGGGVAYVADLTLSNIPMADHPNITRIHENQSYLDPFDAYHPVYVTSIIGAANNTTQARGISNGGIVHASILTISVSHFAAALQAAYLHAEASNRFAPLNFSVNSGDTAFSNHAESLHKWINIASNRFLVSQSAGNHNADACSYAYKPQGLNSSSPIDGIMVVGAFDKNGARATDWPDGVGTALDNGWYLGASNFGPCVDIWAPGKDIAVSSYPDQTYFKNYPKVELNSVEYYSNAMVLSHGYMMAAGGTSFAAPFVTGIAARLSNNNTVRPPQMETMLRATSSSTGYTDPSTGLPIMGVKYNSSAAVSGIKYSPPATSLTAVQNQLLSDGKFETIAWNAGSNVGSFTFNSSPLRVVRFTPRGPGDDGVLNYSIQASSPSAGWITVNSGSVFTYDRVPVTLQIPLAYQQYNFYRINLTKPNGGWIALSEFETYK